MIRKVTDPIIKDKINFLDDNSHILNNILGNRIGNKTVLETITSIVISNKPLDKCVSFNELCELIELNRTFYQPVDKDDSDSYGLIFSVAHYVNDCISDLNLKEEIRERLRVYSNSFKKKRTFSKNYGKFIVLEPNASNLMLKKIGN